MSVFSTRQFATAFAAAGEEQALIVAAKRRFLADPEGTLREPPAAVRPEILQSWKRSLDGGADPDATDFAPPEPVSRSGPLERIVAARRDDITADLDGTSAWIMVLDRRGRAIGTAIGADDDLAASRRNGVFPGAVFREDTVGSNGAAIALERLDAFAVVGAEHFQWRTHNLVTVGAPIRDAVGRLVGVVSMNARLADAHPVLLPLARGIARTLDDAMLDESRRGERVLFAEFMQRSGRRSRPVVAVGDDLLLLNGAARQLLVGGTPLDDVALAATSAPTQRGRARTEVAVADSRYEVSVRASDGSDVGVVAHLARTSEPEPAPGLVACIRRAWNASNAVVVRGEPGAGRAHAVREAAGDAPVVEITVPESPDVEAWFEALHAAVDAAEGIVLVRELDRLSPSDGERMHAELRARGRRFASTAARGWPGRVPLDPIGVVLDRSPLRDRATEFAEIVEAVLRDAGLSEVRVAPEALSVLRRYGWPGNVSELISALSTAAAKAPGRVIELAHLASSIVAEASQRRTSRVDGVRRALLLQALREADWDREAAANALGISRATVYRHLKTLEIRVPTRRHGRGERLGERT